MRVAVLLEDRCKPNTPAFDYLMKYAEAVDVNAFNLKEISARFWNPHVQYVLTGPKGAQETQ